jgi:broad specificity phosphatase PhoE
MKLLIVRHGESNGNATGDYSTETHDRLSPRGREQAVRLAKRLADFEFDKIIVSPLQRALETVLPYLKATGRRAEVWPEVAECCWQEEREEPSDSWRSQPATVPEEIADHVTFRNHPPARPHEAETFGEGLRRVHDTWRLFGELADGSDPSILMVTHGYFIRESLNLILNTQEIEAFDHGNCGLTSLTFSEAWTMDFCNR